jgi:hypothetical protein
MLVWPLLLSLSATLQIARASPTPRDDQQYSPFGKHGGVATEVRAYDRISSQFFLLTRLASRG